MVFNTLPDLMLRAVWRDHGILNRIKKPMLRFFSIGNIQCFGPFGILNRIKKPMLRDHGILNRIKKPMCSQVNRDKKRILH